MAWLGRRYYGVQVRAKTERRGRRVLITGAARGIGAAVARRLHEHGARVALVGLEPDGWSASRPTAAARRGANATCATASRWRPRSRRPSGELGGLDVVVANAGVAAQLPLVGGNPAVFERTSRSTCSASTTRCAPPARTSRTRGGYALAIASLAAAVHAPLLGAYSASKAAVEALGNTLRIELAPLRRAGRGRATSPSSTPT